MWFSTWEPGARAMAVPCGKPTLESPACFWSNFPPTHAGSFPAPTLTGVHTSLSLWATQLLSSPFSSAVNGGASLTRGPMLFQRSLVNVTMVPCSCMCTHMCTHISDSISLPRGVALSVYTPRLPSSSAWDREKTTHMCTEYKTERLVCERGGKT